MSNDYIVKPVYKALQVLLRLAAAEEPMGVTELAHHTKLSKTMVFRYLRTLQALDLVTVEKNSERYQAGLRLWEMGQQVGKRLPIREIALPIMRELRDHFNETVNLGVLDGRSVVYVEIVESHQALRLQATVGSRDMVYSTALGKAMLAFLPESDIPNHVPSRLTPRTSNTLTTLTALRHDLLLTRERGYALDKGENEEGAYCVGAPIRDHQGRVVAALSIASPAFRVNEAFKQEIPATIIAAAATITQRLGYRPSGD
jgi:DNA-binding IclR family transcriptional regulator